MWNFQLGCCYLFPALYYYYYYFLLNLKFLRVDMWSQGQALLMCSAWIFAFCCHCMDAGCWHLGWLYCLLCSDWWADSWNFSCNSGNLRGRESLLIFVFVHLLECFTLRNQSRYNFVWVVSTTFSRAKASWLHTYFPFFSVLQGSSQSVHKKIWRYFC